MSNLLLEELSWRQKLEGLTFKALELQEEEWLEQPFEQMEILQVVRSMVGDKAPSSDGSLLYGFFFSNLLGCD